MQVQAEGRCAGSENAAPAEANELLGVTDCERLPPLTFDYSHVAGFNSAGKAISADLAGYEAFDERIIDVTGSPRHSVDEDLADFFDVNSDALPDLLVTAPGVYGDEFGIFFNAAGGLANRFGAVETMSVTGVLNANAGSIKLSNLNVAPLDLDGDGTIDLLHMPRVKTYAVYTPKVLRGKWAWQGRAIETAGQQDPKIDFGKDASQTRLVDVNFDGLTDVVVSTGTQFQTFFSLGRLPGGDGQFGNGRWATRSSATLSNAPVATCVPYSASPVQLSDPEIMLADMNGDGISDIVRLRRGDIRYWPGRGNGVWGTGKRNDCPAGTFSDQRYRSMAESPFFSDIQQTSLRIDDVNGDGLDDLVQVRTNGVDVWLNVDGGSWTTRHIIQNTPASPSYANRVRLLDINGSGTRDIVWGDASKYRYIDTTGGSAPHLLVQVKNGLGKLTRLDYASSTSEMLTAEATACPRTRLARRIPGSALGPARCRPSCTWSSA